MSTAGADLAMANVNRSNKSKKKEQAFTLFARGYPHPEISKEISVSTRTLTRWKGDYEIQINSRTATKPKSDSEIATTAQNTTVQRIDDLLDLALDNLEDILADEETKKVDKLRAISIVGEWARLGKPIPTDQKVEGKFPFLIEGGECVELKKLSDSKLRELYFEGLQKEANI